MKLSDIVCFDSIVPELKATERDGVIRELIESLASAGSLDAITNPSVLTTAVA